jgi:hypothetical protein
MPSSAHYFALMAAPSTWRRNSVRRLNLLNFKGGADHFNQHRAHTLIELCGQSE